MKTIIPILMVILVFGGFLIALGSVIASLILSRLKPTESRMHLATKIQRVATYAVRTAGIAFVGGWLAAFIINQFSDNPEGNPGAAVLVLLIVAVYFYLVHLVAQAADRKGRSYTAFFAFAMFFLIIAALVTAVMRADHLADGDFVQVGQSFERDEGGWVPAGHRAKILESDLGSLGNPIALIEVADGETTWVSRDRLRRI